MNTSEYTNSSSGNLKRGEQNPTHPKSHAELLKHPSSSDTQTRARTPLPSCQAGHRKQADECCSFWFENMLENRNSPSKTASWNNRLWTVPVCLWRLERSAVTEVVVSRCQTDSTAPAKTTLRDGRLSKAGKCLGFWKWLAYGHSLWRW